MQRMIPRSNGVGLLVALLWALVAATLLPASAQEKEELLRLEQVALSEAQIKGYLKIGPKLNNLFERMDKAGGEPDKKMTAELEALAKEGGFKSFDDLETIVSNITFVMSGINEDDGSFKEPVEILKQELAETERDDKIKPDDKKQLIASIKTSITHTPKVKYPGNIELVRKHFKALVKLFQE